MGDFMRYGVKVIYTYCVENKRFFEESILMLQVSSFDDALDKAEDYVKSSESEYENCDDKIVKLEKAEVLDCFLIYEDDEIVEVYSSFSTNKTSLSDDDFYKAITDIADAEKLYPLRHK